MKRLLLGIFCMVLSGAALAAGPRAVREHVQASMLVTGWITVTPDGNTKSFAIDHAEKLPASVVDLIGKNAPTWHFFPVLRDGKPVVAKARMNLRIVAKPLGDKKYALSIAGSHFGQPSAKDESGGESIAVKEMRPPSYPPSAARVGVSGTVYLVLQVNRQGQVDEEAAEQVNLDVIGTDAAMRLWRKVLGEAAVNAARHWTFTPPTAGPGAAKSSWQVRMPIRFTLSGNGRRDVDRIYGKWHAYVPGPRHVPAWMNESESSGSADAAVAGKVAEVGSGLRLTTPLNGA